MSQGQLRVLVAEDHDFQRRMAVQLLKALGVAEVIEATDGRHALESLRGLTERPDILLTDLDMPQMDGIELIRHVAENRLARAVIIASGLDPAMLHSVEQMARAYGLQVLGNVEKPLVRHRLAAMLQNYEAIPDVQSAAIAANTPPQPTAEALQAALMAREFDIACEPMLDFVHGRVIACEALARWPRSGVDTAAFVPAIEQAGLIGPFTDLIIERAAARQAAWAAQGFEIDITINLSVLGLADLTAADRYTALVAAQGVEPKRVIFEVTETQLMNEAAPSLNVLTRLRLKGFGLAIDDFGTGFSSLQQLSRIPFTHIKIDRQFVNRCDRDHRHRSIIESSLDLARRLKLRTVAEGIETRGEWDVLKSSGCDLAQGWLFGAPRDSGQMPAWAETYVPPGG